MSIRTAKSSLAVLSAFAVALIAAPGLAPAAPPSSCPNAEAMPTAISAGEFEVSVLCLLNDVRSSHGLVALRNNGKLGDAAAGHSASMRWRGYFSHDDPNGTGFASRIQATGYTRRALRWLIGENLAWGSYQLGTPEALMDAWMNSPPHRHNILERRFRSIGVGVDWGSPQDPSAESAIVTTDFGVVKRR